MKYCPNCGTGVDENNKFCSNCGQPLKIVNDNSNPNVAPQYHSQPPSKKRNSTGSIIVFVILLIILIFPAVRYFLNLPATNYKNGCVLYSNGAYEEAKECFLRLSDNYQNTHLYLILCDGHIYNYLMDDQIEELKNNLDFNDTKSLLLSDASIAGNFLMGYWSSDDGSKNMEVYLQGDTRHYDTNFGNWDKGNVFIKDGVFGIYQLKETMTNDEESIYDMEDLFRISILDKDRISIVLLKENERFVLNRE